jgi:hypothetical protein
MNICSISGIPRTIHTITLETLLTALKRLIEQNAIGKPKGIPKTRVTPKISRDILNPSRRNRVTSEKDILTTSKKDCLV